MHLFIDTNVFLSFYHLASDDLEELRKLGVLLDEGKVTLHLTDQVKEEFGRNRENKIADALKGLREQRLNLQFPQICKDYPEYGELRLLQSTYEQKHSVLLKKLGEDVAASRLKADEIIRDLFEKAERVDTTDAVVAKAQLRIQIGNPPGKNESLGDAISWESLIERVPEGEDLHLVSDDRDYISVLDENSLKGFLLEEWGAKKKSRVIFYRRLSSFFKAKFPQIKFASELEKELAISALQTSKSFAATHAAVARLSKYTQFTAAQLNDIVSAAVSNNQVARIISDEDVYSFLKKAMRGHEGEIEDSNKGQLESMMREAENESWWTEVMGFGEPEPSVGEQQEDASS